MGCGTRGRGRPFADDGYGVRCEVAALGEVLLEPVQAAVQPLKVLVKRPERAEEGVLVKLGALVDVFVGCVSK